MKKIVALLTTLATIFCFTLTAAAYDGPTFPEAKKESDWRFFNPETVDLFYRPDAELASEAFICPYSVNIEVAYHAFVDSKVHIYAYADTVNNSEGTWLRDDRGNTIDFTGHTYEGYSELGCIYLSNGITVVPSSSGFTVTVTEESGFVECPYDTAILMTSGEFSNQVEVEVYSYTYNDTLGVWMTDNLGNTADFIGAGYFTTTSNHTIELTVNNRSVYVYPTDTGFHTQIGNQSILVKP